MGMDKYRLFKQHMFINIETIVNIEHEDLICFKGNRCFLKNLFMSIRHMKKLMPGSNFVFLCTEQFTDKHLFALFAGQGSSSSEHAKCTFIIYYYICLPLCATYNILMQLNSQ